MEKKVSIPTICNEIVAVLEKYEVQSLAAIGYLDIVREGIHYSMRKEALSSNARN